MYRVCYTKQEINQKKKDHGLIEMKNVEQSPASSSKCINNYDDDN